MLAPLQVEWVKQRIQQVPVRLVFESALELMGTTQLGSFKVVRHLSLTTMFAGLSQCACTLTLICVCLCVDGPQWQEQGPSPRSQEGAEPLRQRQGGGPPRWVLIVPQGMVAFICCHW